jgi:cobalamin-dependent methionine synthase I
VALSAGALICFAHCRDNGDAAFEKGKAAYQRAVNEHAAPGAQAFDTALELLERVPPDSTHAAEARSLKEALQRSRRAQVLRALAPAQRGQREEAVEEQLRRCGELAQRLGQTSVAAQREEVQRALEACRRQAEAMDTLHAH